MWSPDVKRLGQFTNAVFTFIGEDGYPFSIRCLPQIDEARQIMLIDLPASLQVKPGPVELLYHHHNEQLWDLKSLQIQGQIEPGGQSWIFRPERFIPGNGLKGNFDQMRSLFKARADAYRYLDKQGNPRPKVCWNEFQELLAEAKKSRR